MYLKLYIIFLHNNIYQIKIVKDIKKYAQNEN